MSPTRVIALLCLAALTARPAPVDAKGSGCDWEQLDDHAVVEVVTRDPDGDLRVTKVWVVRLEGDAYLRTSRSRWLENLRREPELTVRAGGCEFAARAEEVPGDAIVAAVDRASRDKYGWQERFIHAFRFRKPDILRLLPQSGAEEGAAAPDPTWRGG